MRAQRHRAWLGTALTVALGALYLGCAGANRTTGGTPPPAADAAVMVGNPYQTEIVAMMTQISDWRSELKLSLQPSERVVGTVKSARRARNVCLDVEIVEECRDVCTLADHICENAENICSIADNDLRGDEWARDKCSSAKASCKEAGEKCCGCQGNAEAGMEPDTEAGPAPTGTVPDLPRPDTTGGDALAP